MRTLFVAAMLIGVATSAVAQKKGPKPPSTSPLTPEIGYTYASGNYMDLRLANEDGTGAVTLHRGAFGSITQFDLGPRAGSQGSQIAFIEARDLKLLTYEPTGTGSIRTASVQTLYDGPGDVMSLSFSQDGSKIAFYVGGTGVNSTIRILDVLSGTVENELGPVDYADYVAWYHDRSGLVYKTCNAGCTSYSVHELMLDGSSRLLLTEANIEHVDTARKSKDLLVSYSRPGLNEIRVGRWSNGGYVDDRVVAGLLAHFNCDDTRFIYRGFARMKRPTYKYDYGTNTSSTFSNDSDIHHTDWMPTCN